MQYDENAEKYGYEGEMTPLKCDKLQSYKGDVTIPVYGTIADAQVYLKKDVDETIAELKEFAEDACIERDDNQTAIDELQAENAELKKKLEDVQASMYCDVVDANMEVRRLRRALWLARAFRAEARKNYWYARSIHEGDERIWSIYGSEVKYIGCIKRTNFDWLKIWCEVEIKCCAMADKWR